ncbi:hypothetical protein ACCE15_10460 [Pseudomonas parafulva]|uniref:hypothetical protein n=1 Tax=Pseudomonas TaxID=286 RepID=UPI0006D424BF|nr:MULTISPECIES: hypothetical protein [Pseudomonas]KAB5625766.1 hypothetical protein F7234_08250 [Pseudomonas putida]HEK0906411.1 hypothetical protein [Pseudomonas putida]
MNFSLMVNQFAIALPGTDSFKQAKAHCEAIIRDEPFQACAAFLIAGFCRSYVLLYEDQALELEFARRNQRQLLDYMGQLDRALASQDAQVVHQALNQVVRQYAASDRIF